MSKATELQNIYTQIENFDSYIPSIKVNKAFSDLVQIALSETKNNLSIKETIKLQKICSQAEYELEKYWANKIIKSSDPHKTIESFPYYSNYQKLTKLEWYTLLSCITHKRHKIIFVGSGPLPLTALLIASVYKQNITILDIDLQACKLSSLLVNKLGLEKKISIINQDAAIFDGYPKFNTIIVAALAGTDSKTKTEILKKIKLSSHKGSHILARSSFGARKLLYKPLDDNIYKMFSPILEVRPQNEIVNSVVIFQNV